MSHTRTFFPVPGRRYIEFLEAIPTFTFTPNRPAASDPVFARLTDNDIEDDEQ